MVCTILVLILVSVLRSFGSEVMETNCFNMASFDQLIYFDDKHMKNDDEKKLF